MRNFARAPVQHIREEQDGSLTGREQLENREEGERNAFASAYAGFRGVCCPSQPVIRERLKPEWLGRSWRNGGEGVYGRGDPRQQGAGGGVFVCVGAESRRGVGWGRVEDSGGGGSS